jgi:aromatic-L-amino-acid/L-tryptophan decarboxylase
MPDPEEQGDLPPEEFRRLAHEVSDWMADYLAGVGELPVFPDVRPGELTQALPTQAPEAGESMDAVLADFRELVMPGITHWNHPAFFGYFAITGSAPGLLGEMLAAALNVNAMVWRSSPAATELEEVTTGWLRRLMGLPEGFDGVINDTASSSTLYALAAAREVTYPDVRARGMFSARPGRVYASDQAHSSIEKAVLTLGFGHEGYRAVASDGDFRMDVGALRAALEEDNSGGVEPVAIVATLGTTSSSSFDPVAEIAELAEEFGCWLHVDAAYGGPAAIVPEFRPLLDGWQRADSIVVNPHKWLFTQVDCSVLYCRRPDQLVRAFSIVPEYLTAPEKVETRNLMDYGVSLGRRFRSLKLWFVLRSFGREGLIARLSEHVRLASDFAAWVDESPDWERAAPTPLSTVAFRYVGPARDGDLDAANRRILERVNATGDAYMTHTVLADRVALRLSIGNVKTTAAHVERAWKRLNDAAVAEGG